MWLDDVPGRVETDAESVVAERWGRARLWLRLAALVCTAQAVVAVALVVSTLAVGDEDLPLGAQRGTMDIIGQLFIAVVAVIPTVGAAWLLRKTTDWALTPHEWWRYPVFAGFVQSLALALALTIAFGWGFQHIAVVGFVAGIGMSRQARRVLLLPPTPELGGSDFHLRVPVGRGAGWQRDYVTLTSEGLDLTVRSGGERRADRPNSKRISLDSVTGIGVRQSSEADPPWAWLSDGRGLPVPPGDVVVLRLREGEQLLPVENAREFAEALRRRVRWKVGRAPETIAFGPG